MITRSLRRRMLRACDPALIPGKMRCAEHEAGNMVIPPGSVSWLPTEDWPDSVVVSICDNDVRIVLLHARRPGSGAFSRMIDGIAATPLVPVVISPIMLTMPSILKRWGWASVVAKAECQWRPSRVWLANRLSK